MLLDDYLFGSAGQGLLNSGSKILSRASDAAYEPYQEAQARGDKWINYNPFITMDSMYRAGQEGIGETIRQVGDALGYPSQGKELASGVNSGLEYLASRGGSDFPTPGFGIPIEGNLARHVDVPKIEGQILYHSTPYQYDKFDRSAPEHAGNDIGGLYTAREPDLLYGAPYRPSDPAGRLLTLDVPDDKGRWAIGRRSMSEQPRAVQKAFAPYMQDAAWQNLSPVDVIKRLSGHERHGVNHQSLMDITGKLRNRGIYGVDNGEVVLFDPARDAKIIREQSIPDGISTAKIEPYIYNPYVPNNEDLGWNPYKHLINTGALSTQSGGQR